MRALLCFSLLALLAGCGTTTTGAPVYHLRPSDAPAKLAEETKTYAGGIEAVVSFPDFDDVGTNEFKGPESAGFRFHARPRTWYVAPEVGVMITDEGSAGFPLESMELMLGGRAAARMTEVPFEFYAHAGYSYLDYTLGPNNDTSSGFYAGGGVNMLLGGDDGGITIGAGYRFVDHDWDIDGWSEVLFTLGLNW